jgi:integrase
MARIINRLTDLKIKQIKAPGLYPDGAGLYLQVSKTLTRSWLRRYMFDGAAHYMGLGPYPLVGIAEARRKNEDARRLQVDGIDPLERRKADRDARAVEKAKSKLFNECFESWVKIRSPGWSKKSEQVRRGQYATYIKPVLGHLPIADIDTGLVLKVLEEIWTAKNVTARGAREILEGVLDYAKTHGHRTGDNPARWRGHLVNVLGKPTRLHKVQHRAALPYTEIGAFLAKLRTFTGRDADALELIILTGVRVNEVEGAFWEEQITDAEGGGTFPAMDLKNRVWSIPGERMKAGKLHRVPLSPAAMAVIERLPHRTGYLFPNVSDKSLSRLRAKLGFSNITTHGFRSTLRTWAGERTNFPREICEVALAHTVADQVERAYQRGDQLEKRRKLMDAWAAYCAKPAAAGEVVPLRGRS